MWFNELWQRWMGQAPRQLRRRCRPPRARTRLTLEALEERTLLSNPATTSDLIAAIKSANTSSTPTTITLQAGAIFNFTSADNFIDGPNALPVITGNITIVGNNDIIARTSSTADRFFNVASGGSLTLQNLTLQGGKAQGIGTAAEGGAIYSSGTLNLSGVTVKNNVALGSNGLNAPTGGGGGGTGANAFGGGLYVAGGSVSVNSASTFSNNFAHAGNGGAGGLAAGGGIYVAGGSFGLNNVTLSGNHAAGGSGGNGANGTKKGFGSAGGAGGAGLGGGLYVAAAGNLTLSNDTFSGNYAVAGSSGGMGGRSGLGILYGAGGAGGAGAGGGLYVAAVGSLTLSHDTLSSNYAFGGSGG